MAIMSRRGAERKLEKAEERGKAGTKPEESTDSGGRTYLSNTWREHHLASRTGRWI
jgi:hypothetical protein